MKNSLCCIVVFLLFFSSCDGKKQIKEQGADTAGVQKPPVEPEYSALQAPADLSRLQRADFFNAEGMKSAAEGKYAAAAALFRNAILENSVSPISHFNLARMLAKLGADGKELYDELAICMGLEPPQPDKKEWMLEELKGNADFASVRNAAPFQALIAHGLPAAPSLADLLAGEWRAVQGVPVLVLKADSSFTYKAEASGSETAGTWAFDGRYLSFGEEPLFSMKGDDESVELDQQHFLVKCRAEDGAEPAFVLRKVLSPLHQALAADDVILMAGLFSMGITPSYPDGSGTYPYELAVRMDRGALVRLFLGNGDTVFGSDWAAKSGSYSALIERARTEHLRERLKGSAPRSEYPVEWYEELVENPPISWEYATSGSSALVWGSLEVCEPSGNGLMNGLRVMGHGEDGIAFLITSIDIKKSVTSYRVRFFYDSASMPGEKWEMECTQDVILPSSREMQAEAEEEEVLALSLMTHEKEWLSNFSEHGMTPDNTRGILARLPLAIDGSTVGVAVKGEEELMSQEGIPNEGTLFLEVLKGGKVIRSTPHTGLELDPYGCVAAGKTLVVFYHIAGPEQGSHVSFDVVSLDPESYDRGK